MIDRESIIDAFRNGKHNGNVAIAACKSNSGALKEIHYSRSDSCFYVTVDGRERLRSDMPRAAYDFFSGPAPE